MKNAVDNHLLSCGQRGRAGGIAGVRGEISEE